MESLCISGASFVSSVPGRQLRHSLLQRNLIHVRRGIQRLKAVETELYPMEPLIDDVKYQVCWLWLVDKPFHGSNSKF